MKFVQKYRFLAFAFGGLFLGACSSRPGKVTESDRVRAYGEIGRSCFNDGRYPEAIESFKAALAIDPKRYDIMVNLGMTYLNVEKLDDALKAISTACDATQNFPDCWNALSMVRLKRGEAQLAKDAAKKALQIDTYPTPDLAMANYAKACLMLGQLKESKEILEKAIRFNPENCMHRTLLAKTWMRFGEGEEALTTIKTAISRCPLAPEIHLWQAYIYYKLGQRRSAQIKYDQIIDIFKTGQAVDISRQALVRLSKKIPLEEPST